MGHAPTADPASERGSDSFEPLSRWRAVHATTLAAVKWSAGMGVRSRHVMAMGRSPRCSTYQGVPQSQLRGDPAVEERPHVGAVTALRRRGEAEELVGPEVVEDRLVGASLCVVELVDDDDRVRIGWEIGDAVCRERLDGCEDVTPSLRAGAADVELTEVGVVQNLSVRAQGLFEDLSTVSDEEQCRSVPSSFAQASVVEGGHNGLAGSRCCDNEIPMPTVHDALDVQLLEHLGLVGIGAHLETRERQGDAVVGAATRGLGQRIVEAVPVAFGVIALEGRVVPVAVKRRPELLDQRRSGDRRESNVPLHSVQQGRTRQVARSDVGRVEAGVASKQPCLGVEASPRCVVLDPHLRAELADEAVEGRSLSGPHVRRGDDAEGHPTIAELTQLGLDHANPVPLDEGHDDVDAICGRDLGS